MLLVHPCSQAMLHRTRAFLAIRIEVLRFFNVGQNLVTQVAGGDFTIVCEHLYSPIYRLSASIFAPFAIEEPGSKALANTKGITWETTLLPSCKRMLGA